MRGSIGTGKPAITHIRLNGFYPKEVPAGKGEKTR